MAKNIDKHGERATLTIYEQFIEAFEEKIGDILTSAEIQDRLKTKFNTNPGSIIPADYCYNRTIKEGFPIKICLYI